jgi:ElaB/YqjD/DUF883 family membrane-anchored ribosome-binding protein
MSDMNNSAGVPLQVFIERILDEREKSVNQTAENLKTRLEHLNQLREEVQKDRYEFLQKSVYDEMHKAIVRRVEMLEMWQSRAVGIGIALVAGAGLLGAVVQHVMRN